MGIIVNSNIISDNSYSKSDIDSKISVINNNINDKADKATTLSGYGITDGLGYKNISNCVTKIPQDIKIELNNNGEITLKKNSIVYIPNGKNEDGTYKFNKVTINSDITDQRSVGEDRNEFCLLATNNTLAFWKIFFSGDSKPETEESTYVWYDTLNNIIKATTDGGTSWIGSNLSFPLCEYSVSNSKITNILQIFNGMGFIGKHMYILPGVEIIRPWGRDNSGNIINHSYVIDNVYVNSPVDNVTEGIMYARFATANAYRVISFDYIQNWINSQEIPDSPFEYLMWYDREENYIRQYLNGKWTNPYDTAIIASIVLEGNKIISLRPNIPLQLVSYDEYKDLFGITSIGKELISTLSKPSTKYINLELQASGSKYTAPANGWFVISIRTSSNSGGSVHLSNENTRIGMQVQNYGSTNSECKCFCPAKKGQKAVIFYTGSITIDSTVQVFCFVYDEATR